MKNLKNKLGLALLRAKYGFNSALKDERGDTNFISIAIILVVIIVVAIAFITFADDIKASFSGATSDLVGHLSY